MWALNWSHSKGSDYIVLGFLVPKGKQRCMCDGHGNDKRMNECKNTKSFRYIQLAQAQ
jgi:hypothetical protein